MIEPIIDISKWQGNVNAGTMLAAGVGGIYVKAGGTDKNNGSSYTDWRFRENADKFAGRIPIGYYYFFYPHFDGAKQARYFVQLYKSVTWNLPPAIDLEDNPLNVNQIVFQREVKAFIDTIQQELNVETIIYTRGLFWNANLGNPAWAGQYKIWLARYGQGLTHPWDNNPASKLRPLPWTDWWMWQYSADENRRGDEFGVESHAIDINRVNMTQEEFDGFVRPSDSVAAALPPPEPTVTEPATTGAAGGTVPPGAGFGDGRFPFQGFLREGFASLRIRSRPSVRENNAVGALKPGYTFTVYRENQLGDDLWWLVELPDGTVGWAAKRYQAVTFLEQAA